MSAEDRRFTDDDRKWLTARGSEVRGYFHDVFAANALRFPSHGRVLAKFDQAVADVLAQGWAQFDKVITFHNELALAELILLERNAPPARVDYEPPLGTSAKTVDFVLSYDDRAPVLVDAKTVHPQMIDRWEQYEDIQSSDLLSPGTRIELSRSGLGGELWHLLQASREHFLEYTLELEDKLRSASDARVSVLVFFSSGFHWHRDELEDFVSFYRSGKHRADDALGRMEAHCMAEHRISLDRSINHFAYFRRNTDSMSVESGTWDVRPPKLPIEFVYAV